ncbi:MAG: 16S rRNA (adenine(1518)-N(6)/adenine(1519)-N(6))-dimethyltransferase RsmA, partial [Bacteroidales bacterium]|nr:16S rRNA (adenine(1518)-N(6)/adenine(1519)-N(6))-dimethyltransferase RsmA [Bacteroidales bacterium]
TKFLLEKGHDLKVVEIDRDSIAYLYEHFPELADGRILAEDFLKTDLKELYQGKAFCLIGNYPYNISSQILFKVLDNRDQVLYCVGMFQKEVAERICSPAGKKSYGILSVFLQAYYDIDYLFTVSEKVFEPPPKVQSAVIRLKRNSKLRLSCDEKLFRKVVKTAFNQRRKTLRNSLKPLLGKETPFYAEAIFDKRPEQLNVKEFEYLTELVSDFYYSNSTTDASIG